MGKHVDKLLKITGNVADEKAVKIEKTKAFKELVERINTLEKAVEGLSTDILKLTEKGTKKADKADKTEPKAEEKAKQ